MDGVSKLNPTKPDALREAILTKLTPGFFRTTRWCKRPGEGSTAVTSGKANGDRGFSVTLSSLMATAKMASSGPTQSGMPAKTPQGRA